MKKPKKNMSIDDLAVMVANGFNNTNNSVNARFDSVDKRLKTLEDGQDQIKLRLDNVAYRFELVELQRRVKLLEKKVGVANS